VKNVKLGEDYETPVRMPGEPVRIISEVDIDYGCFKKSKAEKELLKAVKAQAKIDELKNDD
jgi:hypothetical protein